MISLSQQEKTATSTPYSKIVASIQCETGSAIRKAYPQSSKRHEPSSRAVSSQPLDYALTLIDRVLIPAYFSLKMTFHRE